MKTDDTPAPAVSEPLSRREILRLAGALGALSLAPRWQGWLGGPEALAAPLVQPGAGAAVAGSFAAPAGSLRRAAPACVVRPQQTEGPYFVDERLLRSDIRPDPSNGAIKPGAEFTLQFNVMRVDGDDCEPLPGALVDIWHCDAEGLYSDVLDGGNDLRGQKFLRGYQVTDANGQASFTTVYPGWYQGRTVHIHFKIRLNPDAAAGFEYTSQLYFDDTLSDTVFRQPPYVGQGVRGTRNGNDGIYSQGGMQLMLVTTQVGDVYTATFDIGLQGLPALPSPTPGTAEPSATPTASSTTEPPTPTTPSPATDTPTPGPTAVDTPEPLYLPWGVKDRP